MNKYLLSEQLHQLLVIHKSVFPTKRNFQAYVKKVLRARFSSDFYTDARNRRPTQYQFLLNLLLYLRDKEHEFISEHMREDWQALSAEQLANKHIIVAPDDYAVPARSTDSFKLGPTHFAAELFTRIHDDGNCRPATVDDIGRLAEQIAIGVGDAYNLDFTPPAEEAEREGEERFGYNQDAMRTILQNAIEYCGNSVWIRPDKQKPEKTLLSWIAPVRDEHYELFRTGMIDEAELFSFPPCEHANQIVLISMLGHARHNGWLGKSKAKTDLMFMLWRQIGLVSSDVLENGLKLLTFHSTEMNGKRLQAWGFVDTKHRMKRTGFPVMELVLSPGGRKPGGAESRYIWPIAIVYQSLGKNKPAQTSTSK